ncbi:MAG TPA: Uma2 family endonuclease [Nostocaceae cyanobacterium]|nr:Uma2 family endonuclease [Nostocaceae cyanobacterium]
MTAITVNFNRIIELTDDEFYHLCRENPDIKFERNAQGEILIMSPTGGETGNSNIEIGADFVIWNSQNKLGYCFDSSTCFQLPNGANHSPDVAWIKKERWEQLTPEQRKKFPPIAPDFVLELMSPSDNLKAIQEKMREYMANQIKLGWLINPEMYQVEIYRQNQPVEILTSPTELSGEDVLPGFTAFPCQMRYIKKAVKLVN